MLIHIAAVSLHSLPWLAEGGMLIHIAAASLHSLRWLGEGGMITKQTLMKHRVPTVVPPVMAAKKTMDSHIPASESSQS